MKQNLTPLQVELKKLLTVLQGDRTSITDKYLSITPVEERQDWLDAIGDVESYLMNYSRNQKIIQAYERHLASKKEKERE